MDCYFERSASRSGPQCSSGLFKTAKSAGLPNCSGGTEMMSRIKTDFWPVSCLTLLSFALLAPATAQINPNQVATLRWYPAVTAVSFPVGAGAYGVAYDGANIWVAGYSSLTLTKLRANDGAVLSTIPIPSGAFGVAFDGANIWVTGYPTNIVT